MLAGVFLSHSLSLSHTVESSAKSLSAVVSITYMCTASFQLRPLVTNSNQIARSEKWIQTGKININQKRNGKQVANYTEGYRFNSTW